MKRSFNILLIVFATLLVVSCDKTKSYTDMLNAEKKAISRLIDEEGIEVLDDYPENGVFGPNQYVKLENGVYLNVIDSGNGQRAVQYKTNVFCRFIAENFMTGDTVLYDNLTTSSTPPVEFKYDLYTSPIEGAGYFNQFLGEGINTPLAYVGDSSYVKLIVPFKRMGQSSSFQQYGYAVYFKKVRYTFAK